MKYKLMSFVCLLSFVEKGFAASFISATDLQGLVADSEEINSGNNPLSANVPASPNGSNFSSRCSSSPIPYEPASLRAGDHLADYSNTVNNFARAVGEYNNQAVGEYNNQAVANRTPVPKLVIVTSSRSSTTSSPLRTSRTQAVVSFVAEEDSSAT
jgi:hypothetical protein